MSNPERNKATTMENIKNSRFQTTLGKDPVGRGRHLLTKSDHGSDSPTVDKKQQLQEQSVPKVSMVDWAVLEQHLLSNDKDVKEMKDENGITPLMLAAEENRIPIMERLIDIGVSVNETAKDGQTALHFAASFGREDTVKFLLSKKADPMSIGGPYDQLPIHMACERTAWNLGVVQILGKVSRQNWRLIPDKRGFIPLALAIQGVCDVVCQELLRVDADMQLQTRVASTGDTLLHIACLRRSKEMCKLLIKQAVPVNATNNNGQTPLHLVARMGDEALFMFLIENNANPFIMDKSDKSPLMVAAEQGHTDIVEHFIEKCKHSEDFKDNSKLMHIAVAYGNPKTALDILQRNVPLFMPDKDGYIPLHLAAIRGHVTVIQALINKGAFVDAKTKAGFTALHLAVTYFKPHVVEALLGCGAQVNLLGGPDGESPLHIASRVKGGEQCALILLKSGAEVNSVLKQTGETPLHVAVRFGKMKMILALLEDGADLMQRSQCGETALHIAVRYGHSSVVQVLLNYICRTKSPKDASILVNLPNNEGETSVHLAAELAPQHLNEAMEDVDIISYLFDFNGAINRQTLFTLETPLFYCARTGCAYILEEMLHRMKCFRQGTSYLLQDMINKQAKNGQTPLHVASEQGHLQIVQILLKSHARVDVFDEQGKTALHLATQSGHYEVVNYLLWNKAFVNVRSKQGLTPLHLAAAYGYDHLVNLLLTTHEAAIDACTLAKQTPLHMAAWAGHMNVCSTLLKFKADLKLADEHGQTPVHIAAEMDNSEVVMMFVRYKPDLVNMTNKYGMTCAHIAAAKGSVAVLRQLMRFSKTLVTTAKSKSQSTPLHLAAAAGHAKVMELLLSAGASPTDEDADGMTAGLLAAKNGHSSVLDVLRGIANLESASRMTGLTAIHVAAIYGQTEIVRNMLTNISANLQSETPRQSHSALTTQYPTESGLTILHLAAQHGQEDVVRLLLNYQVVEVDLPTHILCLTPIHLASQNGHTTIVSLLLSRSTFQIHTRDQLGRTPLHLAAANGHLEMVALLLSQGADINAADKNGWTALHFASKAGDLPIVKRLVESKASLEQQTLTGKVAAKFAASASHSDVLSFLLKKTCNTKTLMDDEQFVFDLMHCGKLNNYRCLQEFILLSPAPPDTAAKMSNTLRMLSFKEKERMRDLNLAADHCEAMATELMAIAAGVESAQRLLKSVDSRGVPFLDVLIENNQKTVVAQHSVQTYLSDVWVGSLNWPTWKILLLFFTMLLVPFLWVPCSLLKCFPLNKVPLVKFMTHLVSHVYLIVLYAIVIAVPIFPIATTEGVAPHWNELLLLTWLSGILVSELTHPGSMVGLGRMALVNLAISAAGTLCHLVIFIAPDDVHNILFVRNNILAWSLLISCVQLMDFFSFHYVFGPWVIIIKDMLKDLIRFFVLLLLFIVGFTCLMIALYQPVYPPEPGCTLAELDDCRYQSQNPMTFFEIMFFALFGIADVDKFPSFTSTPVSLSDVLFKIIYGTYLTVAVIVLINLLVAMMSNTFQRIQTQSDIEWKFGRAKLIQSIMKKSSMPSPLNLFYLCYEYFRLLVRFRGKIFDPEAQKFFQRNEDYDKGGHSFVTDTNLSVTTLGSHKSQLFMEGDDDMRSEVRDRNTVEHIKDVVNWEVVVYQYLCARGQEETEWKDILNAHRPFFDGGDI